MAVLLTLLALAVGFAACGGGGGDEQDAEALLDRAFSRDIPSADVEIDAELEVDGIQGLEDPVQIRASGPYISAKQTLPKLDMDLEISAAGAGQAIQTGLLSTGDRVFLKFGGAFFEQPRAQVAQTNRRLARESGSDGGSLSDLGLDPRSWVVDASVKGDEEIGGVAVEHVSGKLEVEEMVKDLNDLLEQSSGALGGEGQAPEPLGQDDIERLADSVKDPTFDVYVGKDDGVLRRISVRLDITVPEEQRDDVNGVTGAAVRFSAELSDVGGEQRVEAPRNSQPIANLTSQLGDLGALAGGLGGSTPTGGSSAPDSGTVPQGSGSGPADVEDFERYGQCLEQARPDDADAIARCGQLVN